MQLFLTLAETLHFGRAAELRHVSPPTLSRAIRQLEDTVGAQLFERDKRSVALTSAGELFRRYAQDALARWSALQEDLVAETLELRGSLTLYGSVTASYSFLHALLTELRQAHPGIEVTLQTGDPEQAIAHVQSGAAQISIGARPPSLPAGISFRTVATTALVFIAAKRAALPRGQTSWRQRSVILPERGVARDHAMQWFRRRGASPQISAQVAGNEAIVSMVSLSDSLGVVPRIVLDNSPLARRVVVLSEPADLKPLEVGLFVRTRNLSNRIVNALWTIES